MPKRRRDLVLVQHGKRRWHRRPRATVVYWIGSGFPRFAKPHDFWWTADNPPPAIFAINNI